MQKIVMQKIVVSKHHHHRDSIKPTLSKTSAKLSLWLKDDA